MSQPSPDAKAVVRAAEALTTQVRRIADALSTPVVEYEVREETTPLPSINAADVQGFCPACGHGVLMLGDGGHVVCTLIDCPDPDAVHKLLTRTDDGPTTADDALRRMLTDALTAEHYRRAREQIVASPEEHSAGMADVAMRVVSICRAAEATTPATTCSARHATLDDGRPCIRAAQHHGDHIDEQGYHWSDTVAVYPTDNGMVKQWVPSPTAGARLLPMDPVHILGAEPDRDADAACRRMETRTCPAIYNGPCGDRPCARFESDDPAPWLDPAETPYAGATTTPKAAPVADEDAQRTGRRASLRNLLDRLDRSTVHHYDEAQLLRQHVETEIREADTARAVAAGNKRHVQALVPELTAAQAAIERVRSEVAEWRSNSQAWGPYAATRVDAALDGTEQPTRGNRLCHVTDPKSLRECARPFQHPGVHADGDYQWPEQPTTETEPPAGNLAAYQAAIARVALVLREAREHREQTDPSERQDCIMCGADHFAEIRDAIKGKQPTTETEQS